MNVRYCEEWPYPSSNFVKLMGITFMYKMYIGEIKINGPVQEVFDNMVKVCVCEISISLSLA